MFPNPSIQIALFLSLLQIGQLSYAESVDLKTILREASTDSLSVQKAHDYVDEAGWKKTEALNGFLPSLVGSINYLADKRYMLVDVDFGGNPVTIPQIIPTSTYSLTANLPLFDGFSNVNKMQAGMSLRDSAEDELDWTKFATERQVTLLYYKTLAAQALKEVAETNLKTLQDHAKDTQALKKAGISTNFEVLRVEVQVSEAQSEVMNATDNLEMARYKLGEALGKEKEVRELSGELPVVQNVDLKVLDGLNIEERKDLKAISERVQSQRYTDTANGRFWVPRISAFGQYQYYNNINDRFDDNSAYREAYQYGVNLTWNFFDGMTAIAKSGQSTAQLHQSEKTLQMAKIKSAQDIEFWKRKLKFYESVYQSRNGDVGKSNEALRLSREGRRVGTRTSTDVLDSELDLFRSRAGQVNAQIGAIEAVLNLELATGQKLYNFAL